MQPNETYHFVQNNDLFRSFSSAEIFSGTPLEFAFNRETYNRKIAPILELARPGDASEIVKMYKETYNGTYPYKEMEDEREVRKFIEDPSVRCVIFIDPSSREIAGCVTFVHDFYNKRGYVRGFMVKKEYQGRIDTVKAMLGSTISTYGDFKGKILSWYVENRTAHTSSQYPMYLCGLEPIGFYPNKDVFFNRVESDLMQILYDERAFTDWNPEKSPTVIFGVKNCYEYSAEKYPIRGISFRTSTVNLRKREIIRWKSRIKRRFSTDKFGYHYITLYYLGSDSFFKFLYTPQVQNFEKTEYDVENNEQLHVFVQDWMILKKILKIRYLEAFVSAYEPNHQTIFYNAGLKPRGYVPRWKYNSTTKKLDDCVLFNSFEGKIDRYMQLIEEGKRLLDCINLKNYN